MSSTDDQISVGQQLSFPPGVRISVTSEELPADAQHRRWRVTILFAAALMLFIATFIVSLWFAFLSKAPDAELRRSAVGILITLTGALAGFLGGRATR